MEPQFSPFRDRNDAGQRLALHLAHYADRPDAVVLGLARGGLPVAQAIAQALHLPLDVLLVRKLGVPGHEELAFGAIAAGVRVLNEDVVARLNLPERVIEETTQRELAELARREALYRGERGPAEVEGRTVILVDDGLATGASMRVALIALRQHRPARIVAAVPVAAEGSLDAIAAVADEFVCPLIVPLLFGISVFYGDFSQVSDAEVRTILADAKK
ncbi:MAG: phosphoribosyltransferase [Chloroflexi bacterium]|nr:phosphoribosyltransferase [Chloroflexota bacterium]